MEGSQFSVLLSLSLSSYCVFLLALAIVFQSVVRVCDLFVMHSFRIVVLVSVLVYCLIVPSSAQLYLVCLAAFWSKLLSDVRRVSACTQLMSRHVTCDSAVDGRNLTRKRQIYGRILLSALGPFNFTGTWPDNPVMAQNCDRLLK
jgi:hypothetical protein